MATDDDLKSSSKDAEPVLREEKSEAGSVWGRGGEGPHALVAPHMDDADAVDPAKTPETTDGLMVTADAKVVHSVFEHSQTSPAGVLEASPASSGESQSLTAASQPDAASVPAPKAESDLVAQPEVSAQLQARPLGPNDVAIGYTLPLIVFFLLYAGNCLFGGYCFYSDKFNAFAAILFCWSPALAAACLLSGDKKFKITGLALVLPAVLLAIWAGQYYHVFERFAGNVGPYGQLVKSHDENGWHICNYESSWLTGEQTGSTYTREKSVGPGLRYVRKMFLGEPP